MLREPAGIVCFGNGSGAMPPPGVSTVEEEELEVSPHARVLWVCDSHVLPVLVPLKREVSRGPFDLSALEYDSLVMIEDFLDFNDACVKKLQTAREGLLDGVVELGGTFAVLFVTLVTEDLLPALFGA